MEKEEVSGRDKLFPEDKEKFKQLLAKRLSWRTPVGPQNGYGFPLATGTMRVYEDEASMKAIYWLITSWARLAMKFVDKYGEEARELIKQVEYEAGYKTGERYARLAGQEPGTVRDFDVLKAGWNLDYPFSNGAVVERTDKRMVNRTIRCAVAEITLATGLPKELIGPLMCDGDFALIKGLFGKNLAKVERRSWMVDGDPFCEYVIELV